MRLSAATRVISVITAALTVASAGSGAFAQATPTLSDQAQVTSPAPPGVNDFAGMIAVQVGMGSCSGSLVRFPQSEDGDKAMVLTNGHCYAEGDPTAEIVHGNKPFPAKKRTDLKLLSVDGKKELASYKPVFVHYAIDMITDVSLYGLKETYGEIKQKTGISALTLAKKAPVPGDTFTLNSGHWKLRMACKMEAQVHTLKEDFSIWKESIRYAAGCETKGGTSGSPLVNTVTGEVAGIHNTHNADGKQCTVSNPCEVDANGKVSVIKNRSYGQQTWWLTQCVNQQRTFDTSVAGCPLPKPNRS